MVPVEVSDVMGSGEWRTRRLQVVVSVSWEERDGGRMVARRLRSSVVVVGSGRESETVEGRERPEKVFRRTLTRSPESIVAKNETSAPL